jgi:glycosyltransferase involved in cell wall biosynthesis
MASVDIAIPCYQHGRFLRDCVESVLQQGIKDTRVVIIDNASTDDSVDIARQLASEDPRVALVAHASNLGPHASFNEGVGWAAADYFMVLCADDLLAPGSLARAIAIMEQVPELSFAYGTDVHWGTGPRPSTPSDSQTDWQISSGSDFITRCCRNPERYIAAGMVLVRTAAQKATGYYRPELPHTDDFEVLLRLALQGPVAFTRAVQGIKRMHGANQTDDILRDRPRDLAERLSAIDCFFDHEGQALVDANRLRRLGRRSISERAYWCGVKDLVRGRRSAGGLLRLAVELDPSVAVIPPLNYLLRMRSVSRDNPAVF